MRTVLISGGSRGIGAAIVKAFAAAGDRVAFFYRENKAAAAAVENETGARGFCCDVSDPAAVRAAVAAVRAALGPIEVLVNNAGVSLFCLSRDTDDAAFRRVMDTDFSGVFYLCREVQPDMIRAGGGRIINIGSMWGKYGASMESVYSAAKGAVRSFTLALAKELGPSGVTVNCVEPGVIDTDMNAVLSPETLAGLADETPLCRLGRPEEVAAGVLFLASPEASYITGQFLGIDGGI